MRLVATTPTNCYATEQTNPIKLTEGFGTGIMKTPRTRTTTTKVRTDFGSMFIHIEQDHEGLPVGGSISHPGKEPTSQIVNLVEILSKGLDEALGGDGNISE